MVKILRSHCSNYKILGFRCEWVHVEGNRKPVALLQLCSPKAFCVLFRVYFMRRIPKSLRALLADKDIIKVGVDIVLHAKKLTADYGIEVVGAFDLRYMALIARRKPPDLYSMSFSILNVKLTKALGDEYDWEAKKLNDIELEYAANNAYASVEIFKSLAFELDPNELQQFPNGNLSKSLCFALIFRSSWIYISENGERLRLDTQLYYNLRMYIDCSSDKCLLLAPDDEFVCFVDKSYYQGTSETQCHICGQRDVFVHKTIVPMEYRIHFPEAAKALLNNQSTSEESHQYYKALVMDFYKSYYGLQPNIDIDKSELESLLNNHIKYLEKSL
uniref:3'-5' exonuclease domain-containing protein n=1 Tax=Glossina brevipalpis TaxID=37001 RepID=A0A1A9WQ42_9MUSC